MRIRRLRVMTLAATVMAAGMVFQATACIAPALNFAMAAFDVCSILGPNCTLGPFGFCGSNLTNEDDLLLDCPPVGTP